MNKFTAAFAAVLFAATFALPALAHAETPTGVVAALDACEGTAVERLMARDETLGERIARAYHAPERSGAADTGAVAALDRSAFGSASLWRVLRSDGQLNGAVAAR